MNPQQELNLTVLSMNLGRCIEEIIFCTVHPQLTGLHRREIAIKSFGASVTTLINSVVNLDKK